VTQSKKDSLIESITNIVIRAPINMFANTVIFPLFGYQITLAQNFGFMVIFTFISLAVSYGIRRAFNGKPVWQTIKENVGGIVNG